MSLESAATSNLPCERKSQVRVPDQQLQSRMHGSSTLACKPIGPTMSYLHECQINNQRNQQMTKIGYQLAACLNAHKMTSEFQQANDPMMIACLLNPNHISCSMSAIISRCCNPKPLDLKAGSSRHRNLDICMCPKCPNVVGRKYPGWVKCESSKFAQC